MEDYAAKMALKSDAALREYVTGYAQYREDAVLAAFDELRRRGQPAPEETTLRPQLEVAAQAQAAAAEAARLSRAESIELPAEEQPVLYTPGVIVLFSVLFNTIIAGAVLLAMNFSRLKRTKAIWGLVAFVLAYLIGEAVIVNIFMQKYTINPLLVPLLNLPAILAYILWFWPRYVGTYQFKPRGWLLPLLICFSVMLALGLLLQHIPGAAQLMKQQMQQQ
ncbi:hypothetical protein [Hymenobacter sp. BRD67]|uniref:hypothetical protein n=1 Tax=Hymenobacter sp. BRD67 TaxID=2675877 RepID=UPI001563BD43|nr:hypothetical protein [Hymenobacter sp. BRD67]QKG53935.1 hypothetical protein GKZ67_16655 [Hymenobacter sp. BRD67]